MTRCFISITFFNLSSKVPGDPNSEATVRRLAHHSEPIFKSQIGLNVFDVSEFRYLIDR